MIAAMSEVFTYRTTVPPEWIDYNGHMLDANYGLVFSRAVDDMQEEIGAGAAYRRATGCTVYLLEDHKVYLREVKAGAVLLVEIRVIGVDAKRFNLHKQMFEGGALVCAGEFMELHVNQHPEPHAEAMPDRLRARLARACLTEAEAAALPYRARAMGFGRTG